MYHISLSMYELHIVVVCAVPELTRGSLSAYIEAQIVCVRAPNWVQEGGSVSRSRGWSGPESQELRLRVNRGQLRLLCDRSHHSAKMRSTQAQASGRMSMTVSFTGKRMPVECCGYRKLTTNRLSGPVVKSHRAFRAHNTLSRSRCDAVKERTYDCNDLRH